MSLVLFGQITKARFIAFEANKKNLFPVCFDIEDGDPYPTAEAIGQELGVKIDHIEERRNYYYLPLQEHYNQPVGTVDEISLFPSDFANIKKCLSRKDFAAVHPYWWIFDSEAEAWRRAQD